MQSPITSPRQLWLDNLRWVTVILVLLYHVIYMFNAEGVFGGIGGFYNNQPQDVYMNIVYPWFMMLLFLVAGICSRYSLDNKGRKQFFSERTRKLLVPATIGLFVLQWITGYFNTKIAGVASNNPDIISAYPVVINYLIMAISGTGPLWFAHDLWLFSLVLYYIKAIDKKDKFYTWCGKSNIVVILLLGVLVWAGAQTIIAQPQNAAGLYNMYKPLSYIILYLLGYFVFSHEKVQNLLVKFHLPLLAAAVICGVAFVWNTYGQNCTDTSIIMGWLNNLYAWLMILALMGCFKTWFDKTDKFATYMTKSSFGIYVLHYLPCTMFAYMLKVYTDLSPLAMYVILFCAVMFLTPGLYEIIKRIPFIRWCVLGIKKTKVPRS